MQHNAPDVRFRTMIERLQDGAALPELFADFQGRRAGERARSDDSQAALDWLTRRLSLLDPHDTFLDNRARRAQAEALLRSWSPGTALVVSSRGEEPLPTMPYIERWIDKFPHAFADSTLTLEGLRGQLELANRRQTGLALSIAMLVLDELHLTRMPYPPGDNGNPSSWEAVLSLLNDPEWELPTSAGVFSSASVVELLEQVPRAHCGLTSSGTAGVPGTPAAAGHDVLRRTVQTCTDVELSLAGVQALLEFRGIGDDAHYSCSSCTTSSTPDACSIQIVPASMRCKASRARQAWTCSYRSPLDSTCGAFLGGSWTSLMRPCCVWPARDCCCNDRPGTARPDWRPSCRWSRHIRRTASGCSAPDSCIGSSRWRRRPARSTW